MASKLSTVDWSRLRDAYREALEKGQLEGYRKRRWQRCEEFGGWLAEGELASLSDKQALALYRASGGSRIPEFKTNSIDEVRDSLDFLLYDTIKLEGRFDECAAPGGGYKLAGAGKEFVSYLLNLRDPSLFALWSAHGDRLLRRVGIYSEGIRKGNLGMGYMDLLEALHRVRGAMGLADFRAVDEFAYAVTRPETRLAT